MENPKRARSGKPRIQPRGSTCVDSSGLPSAVERIRQAASRDKELRFTGLWHHVYPVDRLREAYYSLKRGAAPGIDGETWRHYGENLEENLQDLSGRLKRGVYRAKPVRRAYILKADGRQNWENATTSMNAIKGSSIKWPEKRDPVTIRLGLERLGRSHGRTR